MNNSLNGRRIPFLISLAVLFTMCLLLVPASWSPFQQVLGSIACSLDAGLNWGRQCLVGSIRYPLLPVLWTWLCLHAGPCSRVLSALPAFGCLYFLCRWYFLHRPSGRCLILDCLLLVLTGLFSGLHIGPGLQLGPEAFLLTAFLFYMLRFMENKDGLGNMVMGAFCMGLLTLCGFLTILHAGLILLEISSVRGFLKNPRQGLYINLCLPFCYGLLLILMLNWLIMGDCLFYFHDAYLWTAGRTGGSLHLKNAVLPVLLINLPGMLFPALLILGKKRKCRQTGRLLLFAGLLVILREMLRTVLDFQADQMQSQGLLLGCWGAMILLLETKNRQSRLQSAGAYVLLLLFLLFHWQERSRFAERISSGEVSSMVSRTELEQYIDYYWKDSRVLVLGDRLPAMFGDYTEKRYISRLDYQKWEILKQAEDEQLHLLLPPPESGCYPGGKHSPLLNLYQEGAPWLLLEKQFPDGWQLLRVVPPPKGESRLERFLK